MNTLFASGFDFLREDGEENVIMENRFTGLRVLFHTRTGTYDTMAE
jgi:hypothetical protein